MVIDAQAYFIHWKIGAPSSQAEVSTMPLSGLLLLYKAGNF